MEEEGDLKTYLVRGLVERVSYRLPTDHGESVGQQSFEETVKARSAEDAVQKVWDQKEEDAQNFSKRRKEVIAKMKKADNLPALCNGGAVDQGFSLPKLVPCKRKEWKAEEVISSNA